MSRSWVFGDSVDTDQILPSQYMLLPIDEMKKHAMEPQNLNFGQQCQVGDFVIGGDNFGCGSSREQAPMVLKALGVKAVIAKSFARIFYRNSVNLGLPLIELSEASQITEGETLEIDFDKGLLKTVSQGEYEFSPIKGLQKEILDAGGLVPLILQKRNVQIIETTQLNEV